MSPNDFQKVTQGLHGVTQALTSTPLAELHPNVQGVSTTDKGKSSKKRKADDESKIHRKKATKDKKANGKYDIGDVKLPGESEESVPIYDTCAEIRRKINAYLREGGTSKAGFLREIAKTFPGALPVGMSTHALQTFLRQKAQMTSGGSPIYYAAYVFFEKVRIENGKPKSKKREQMEHVWGKSGVERISSQGVLCKSQPYEDEFGRLVFTD